MLSVRSEGYLPAFRKPLKWPAAPQQHWFVYVSHIGRGSRAHGVWEVSLPSQGRAGHRDLVAARVSDSHVRPAGAPSWVALLSAPLRAHCGLGEALPTPPAASPPGSLCAGLRRGRAGRANVCDGFWTLLHAASLFFNFILIVYMLPELSHRTWQSPSRGDRKGCTVSV